MIDFHGARLDADALRHTAGTYEQQEMDLADRTFCEGDRVVVAGGGMGWLAAWIGQRVATGNAGSVLVVEPLRHLAELVAANVAVDGMPLNVLCGALTPGGESTTVMQDPRNWALTHTGTGTARHDVPGVDLLSMHAQGYDCLALDVEGDEVRLLTAEVLAGTRKLLLELHDFAVDTAALEKRLHASGLHLLAIDKRDGPESRFQVWARRPEETAWQSTSS